MKSFTLVCEVVDLQGFIPELQFQSMSVHFSRGVYLKLLPSRFICLEFRRKIHHYLHALHVILFMIYSFMEWVLWACRWLLRSGSARRVTKLRTSQKSTTSILSAKSLLRLQIWRLAYLTSRRAPHPALATRPLHLVVTTLSNQIQSFFHHIWTPAACQIPSPCQCWRFSTVAHCDLVLPEMNKARITSPVIVSKKVGSSNKQQTNKNPWWIQKAKQQRH